MYKNISHTHKHIIIFDGICRFCSKSIIFIYKQDKNAIFKFTTALSPAGEYLLQSYEMPLDYNESIVYIENGIPYTKSKAVIKIASALSWPWKFLVVFNIVPTLLRDYCYYIVAKNRYKIMSKVEKCITPTAEFKNRFI